MSKLIMKHRCWCGSTEFEIPGPGEVVCKKCSREHAYQVFFADEEDLVCAYCDKPANYVALIPSVSLYVCEQHKDRTATSCLVPVDGTTAPDGTGGFASEEASSPASASQSTASKADEKGLKLSHRLILRFVMEYGRSLKAFTRLEGSTELATIVNEGTVLAAIGDLLVLGMRIAERLGSPKEVSAYLDAHEDEDIEQIARSREQHYHQAQEMLHERIKGQVEEVLLRGDPCAKCGAPTCLQCKTCHRCEEAKIEAAKKEQLN
jgi:hypothetical protein